MSDVGKRIRILRGAESMTQRSFAGIMRISQSHVANLEAGNTEPSDHLLSLICEKLEVSFDWLKHGRGPMYMPQDATDEEREKFTEWYRDRQHILDQTSAFRDAGANLDIFLRIHEASLPSLIDALNRAREADPTLFPVELAEKLRQLLLKRHGEPFVSAEKLLKRYDSNFERNKI